MLNEATKANLRRKSYYVDAVQMLEGEPLFSWIDINPTELCNRRCVFCPRVDPDDYPNQPLHMSLDLAGKIAAELRDLSYGGAVVLSGFGEPTLHPQFGELVAILGPTCRLELVTNGDTLSPAVVRSLVDAGLDYFVVSVYDGPHQLPLIRQMFAEAGCGEDHSCECSCCQS